MSVVAGDVALRLDATIGNLIRKARAGGADCYAVLAEMTRSAVRHEPAIDHAGITVVEDGAVVRSIAATDGHALVIDNIQRQQLEGPGYDSAADRHTHRIEDLGAQTRWPAFAEKAAASTPIQSIIAFPVSDDDNLRAALNFYSDTVGAFDAAITTAGTVYANHIARLLAPGRARDRRSQPKKFDVVEMGKATLMQRFGIDPAAALSVLIRLSKECNESLEQFAHRLVGLRPIVDLQPQSAAPLSGARREGAA